MARARGKTGEVRGLPVALVNEVLEELVGLLIAKRPQDRTYSRAEARKLLEEKWELSGSALEGFLLALDRLPGNQALGEGQYRLPPNPRVWAANRLWRYTPGRMDLKDAWVLYEILRHWEYEGSGPPLTDNLKRQGRRLHAALSPLLPHTLAWPEPVAPPLEKGDEKEEEDEGI